MNSDKKNYLILIGVFLILGIIFFKPEIKIIDGLEYYSFVRSIVIDQDLNNSNEYLEICSKLFENKITGSSCNPKLRKITQTGYAENRAMFGAVLFWIPFFLFGHLISFLFNMSLNGYSNIYFISTMFGTIVFGFLTLILTYKLLAEIFNKQISIITTLIYFASSSLIYYIFNDPSLNHSISVFTITSFIYFWFKTIKHRTRTQWIILGFIGGLMTITRWNNLIFMIIPLLEVINQIFKHKQRKITFRILKNSFLYMIMSSIIFLLQLIVLKIVHGKIFLDLTRSNNSLMPINFFKILFSDHGQILWTPIIIFSFVGLYFLFKQKRELTTYLLIPGIITLIALGMFEHYLGGNSYGIRYLLCLTPILFIGLGKYIELLSKHISTRNIILIFIPFIIWNILLLTQSEIHPEILVTIHELISFKEILLNQLSMPQMFIKMLFTRFGII